VIRLITLFLMLLFLSLFAYANHEENFALAFFWGIRFQPIPLSTLLMGVFFAGILTAASLMLPGWLQALLAQRRQKKRVESLEREIDRLRADLASEENSQGHHIDHDTLDDV